MANLLGIVQDQQQTILKLREQLQQRDNELHYLKSENSGYYNQMFIQLLNQTNDLLSVTSEYKISVEEQVKATQPPVAYDAIVYDNSKELSDLYLKYSYLYYRYNKQSELVRALQTVNERYKAQIADLQKLGEASEQRYEIKQLLAVIERYKAQIAELYNTAKAY